jgi:stearoyl-CoA desaturase (delta-9 desaturase)
VHTLERGAIRRDARTASGAFRRSVAAAVVTIPALATLYALASALAEPPSRVALFLLALFYVATVAGIEVGFHRLVAHRAFTTYRALRALFICLGSMGGQGPVIFWVAEHRAHHAHADREGDPHSPRVAGGSALGPVRGIVHAHVGWLFTSPSASWARFAADLLRERYVFRLNMAYPALVVLGLALPAAIAGAIGGTWRDAFEGLLWGGLVRMWLVHNVTWSVNSVCHRFGRRPFDTRCSSGNVAWLALPSLGGSWHNNHHAFPRTASNSFAWWQLDGCGRLIMLLGACRLAWHIRGPGAGRAAGESR